MLDFFDEPARPSRRAFLRVGALGLGGLTLADLLRLEAKAASGTSGKSIIMVYLPGGPSHIDLYDMKPEAPVEIRGEFNPIPTNVPGMHICELLPRQARIADKFAILRGLHTNGSHEGHELTTGYASRAQRPAFGSVVSRLRPSDLRGLPPYVSLVEESNLPLGQDPTYLGPSHRPFALRGPGMANLTLARGTTRQQLEDRTALLRHFDVMRRDLDTRRELAGMDAFTNRALEMITSPRARAAFNLDEEPAAVRGHYGRNPASQQFLLARRLVEAGVRVVTLCGGWVAQGQSPANLSNWDTHEENFPRLREQLPHWDRTFHALLTDLDQRGLAEEVVVIAWGEMGRAPRIGRPNDGSNVSATGRDHWPNSFALVAGGGLRTGQVVGATDRHGAQPQGTPYTPQNVLATLYDLLDIDPATTLPDHSGRPQYLVDHRTLVAELL
jgi:hypothetical protein